MLRVVGHGDIAILLTALAPNSRAPAHSGRLAPTRGPIVKLRRAITTIISDVFAAANAKLLYPRQSAALKSTRSGQDHSHVVLTAPFECCGHKSVTNGLGS